MSDKDILACAAENDVDGIENHLKSGVDVNTTILIIRFLFRSIFH